MSSVINARWLTPRQRGLVSISIPLGFSPRDHIEDTVGAMATVDLVYDPYDYAIDADPHPVWKRLRDEAPVYYNEKYDFYALSRFDDVLAAHLDPATFSSAHTTVLEMMREDIV